MSRSEKEKAMGHVAPSLEAESGGQAETAKHTPGPWQAVFADDPRGQPVPYYSGLVCLIAEGDQRISVVAQGGSCTAEEWAANAKLIAAAPEMRAALMFAREILEEADARLGYEPGSLGAIEMAEAFEMIEAALNGPTRPPDSLSPLGAT